MSRQFVSITDRASGAAVEAILDTAMPLVRVVDAEAQWAPFRLDAIRRFLAAGRTGPLPEHWHWNWAGKCLTFDNARHAVFGIETGEQAQGLMWLWVRGRRSRLSPDPGQPLVYVDFLEVAPWNAREYTANLRFKGVGTRLLQAAVVRSCQEGFEGRLGLHALPQSEAFYAGSCGMHNLGSDAAYSGLCYFEFAADAAAAFVASTEK